MTTPQPPEKVHLVKALKTLTEVRQKWKGNVEYAAMLDAELYCVRTVLKDLYGDEK